MPVIDKYNIPFPYPPYPLQEHAVNEIRSFFERESKEYNDQVNKLNKEKETQSKVASLSRKPKWKVAVLESPTGTGKSQILLNSVLSFFFELYRPESQSLNRHFIDSNVVNHYNSLHSCNKECIEVANTENKVEKQDLLSAVPLAIHSNTNGNTQREMTLEEAIMKEREREKTERAKREIRRQVRKRKRVQLAERKRTENRWQEKLKEHGEHIDEGGHDDNDDDSFLIAQNVETEQNEVWSNKMQSTHSALSISISSSSETEYSSSDSEDDECDRLRDVLSGYNDNAIYQQEEEEEEEQEEEEHDSRSDVDPYDELSLSRLILLRKPKVYFASRTHTQLEQLFDDLQITDFAKQMIVRRNRNKQRTESSTHCCCCNNIQECSMNKVEETQSNTRNITDAHYLNAVHVAGRQHLCINSAIRHRASGNSTLLNELCTEAMKYERSPEGRRARHAQNTERQQKKNSILNQSSHLPSSSPSSSATRKAAVVTPLSYSNESICKNNNMYSVSELGAQLCEEQEECEELELENTSSPLLDVEDTGSVFWQEANAHTLPKGCEFCALHRIRALVEYVRRQHRKGQFVSMQEMIKLGQELRACPYLATQVLIRGADVVFIPYSYLVDEEQRERLLGGCSTNPISVNEMRSLQTALTLETETLTQSLNENNNQNNKTILNRCKVQRNRFHRPSRYLYSNNNTTISDCNNKNKSNTHEEDALIKEQAINASASLHGDVVVIDEAHNIADYCRSVSTSHITTLQLQLVHAVMNKYERVYEKRLLSRNKQRIREMLVLIDKLLRFAKLNETQSVPSSSSSTSSFATSSLSQNGEHTQWTSQYNKNNVHVFEFNNWLFDAQIDYIDVYPFLSFLTNSLLLSKLRGFVASVLHKEFNQLAQCKLKERERNALEKLNERRKVKTKTVIKEFVYDTASPSTCNTYKVEDNCCWAEPEMLIHELCTLHHDNWQEYVNRCSFDTNGNSHYESKNENLHNNALVSWHVQNVSRAFQQFVHFLRWLYKSNSSTRVLIEAVNHSNTVSGVSIKLIQLEPGQHTLASLIHQASATILAGGTMEPLLLTVSPLLPLLECKSLPTAEKEQCPMSTSPLVHATHNEEVALDYVYRIKEGHIVPSSSVVVYTLSTGPSNIKLCFSHRAVTNELKPTLPESSPSPEKSTSSTCTLFKELAMTLLNFARLLPHAGVICFFTSHEMESRFVQYLQSTKYYDEINEVKRIFSIYTFMTTHVVKNNQIRFTDRAMSNSQIGIINNCQSNSLTNAVEYTGRNKTNAKQFGARESADVLANMLVEYKRWICNKRSEIDPGNDKSSHNTISCENKRSKTNAIRGAFLFTVMGGKLSEGINFADDLARAVLVIGLPFANAQDVELQLHLKHLAIKQLKQGVNAIQTKVAIPPSLELSSASTAMSVFNTQAEWNLYNDLCMRVVNQCIGRCIRHINDYAAIVLVDCRYGERITLQRKLASWLQPSLHNANTFGECFRGLRAFFDNVAKK